MFRTRFLTTRFVIAFIFVLVLSATAYAFAAANTVEDSKAGDGAGTVAGYAVTAVKYTHDGTTAREKVTEVSFAIDEAVADTTNVYARLLAGTTPVEGWSSACTFATGRYTCTFSPSVSVITVTSLQVVGSSK